MDRRDLEPGAWLLEEDCYAERIAARFSGRGQPYEGLAKSIVRDVRQLKMVNGEPTGDFRTIKRSEARWTGEVRVIHEHLADPLGWRRPRDIFVNSMGDLFHERLFDDNDGEPIAVTFGVMLLAAQHTYQVLTKRSDLMRRFFKEWSVERCLDATARYVGPDGRAIPGGRTWNRPARKDWYETDAWPAPWIWLGVSVENQEAADERIPELLDTPAAVRFLSCEPLLGPIDAKLTGCFHEGAGTPDRPDEREDHRKCAARISWVIAGCESGPGARPCDVAWLRSLRDQCSGAGVPFFLKQAVEIDGAMTAVPPPTPLEDQPGYSPRVGPFIPTIGFGPGSKRKPGGVIGAPYLDGRQHLEFPR